MKDINSSSLIKIEDEAQARAFADILQRHTLLHCVHQPRSAKELTELLSTSMDKVYYALKRLLALKLITIVDEVRRGGRAVKMYRAIGSKFFIPPHFLDDPQAQLRSLELNKLQKAQLQYSDGMQVEMTPEGRMLKYFVSDDDAAKNAPQELWLRLNLAPSDLSAFMDDVKKLADQYNQKKTNAKAKAHIMHFSLFDD